MINNQWKGVLSADEEGADYDSFLNYSAERFLSQYGRDDIKFEITAMEGAGVDETIKSARDTQNAIDVLMAGTFSSVDYAHLGWLAPLNDVIDDFSKNDIPSSFWKECTLQGNTYFYPFYNLPNTLIYNANLFKQAGLDEYITDKNEIATWTNEEFDEILNQLHKTLPSDVAPLMMYAKDEQGDTHTMTLVRSRGTEMFDSYELKLYNEEGIAGFRWIADCYKKGYFPKNTEQLTLSDNLDLLSKGKLAIAMSNPISFAHYNKPELDLHRANFPNDKDGLETAFIAALMAFDNQSEEKLKIAKDFVAFVCSDPDLVKSSINGIPIRQSVISQIQDTQIPALNAYIRNSHTVISVSHNLPNWSGVRKYYIQGLQDLLNGKRTPEETAMYIQEKGNAAITSGSVKSLILK